VTERERRVADEIVRIAVGELKLPAAQVAQLGGAGEPLSARLDSLALLSLVVAVEDRFRIALADDDAAGVRSLEDLARLVAARAAPEALP
jgi:acyl carrier protein